MTMSIIQALSAARNRVLYVLANCPNPFGKTDAQLAQEYRNWYAGDRAISLTHDDFEDMRKLKDEARQRILDDGKENG